ncbi:MAG: hypothetical protein AB7F75_01330 [Planctomycetota bacterium]
MKRQSKARKLKVHPPSVEDYRAITTRSQERCFFTRQTTARLIGKLIGESMSAAQICNHKGTHGRNLRRLQELNSALETALMKLHR